MVVSYSEFYAESENPFLNCGILCVLGEKCTFLNFLGHFFKKNVKMNFWLKRHADAYDTMHVRYQNEGIDLANTHKKEKIKYIQLPWLQVMISSKVVENFPFTRTMSILNNSHQAILISTMLHLSIQKTVRGPWAFIHSNKYKKNLVFMGIFEIMLPLPPFLAKSTKKTKINFWLINLSDLHITTHVRCQNEGLRLGNTLK